MWFFAEANPAEAGDIAKHYSSHKHTNCIHCFDLIYGIVNNIGQKRRDELMKMFKMHYGDKVVEHLNFVFDAIKEKE